MASGQRLIVDLGCGNQPWLFKRFDYFANPFSYKKGPEITMVTPLMEEFATPRGSDRFVCVDINERTIGDAQRNIAKAIQRHGELGQARIAFVVVDGAQLPFGDRWADAVILADILSAPQSGTTAEIGDASYPMESCIDERIKCDIVKQALRILRDDGLLIIDICLTPCYAAQSMQWFENEFIATGKVKLVMQCGEFVPTSSDWHLYHAAFQKKEGPFQGTPTIIPWTEVQKEYARGYTHQFLDY